MTDGFIMKRFITGAIATLLLTGYVSFGVKNIVSSESNIKVQEVKSNLRSSHSQLKTLQLKYNSATGRLNNELHQNKTDDEKLKLIESEKQKLQETNEDLNKQLQSKAESKRLLAQQQEKANALASTAPQPTPVVLTDSQSLMAQAGIAPADFVAVDYIVRHEGGWDGVTQWNTSGSGAYGLCQALPASKMASAGADYMTNPVTQLKWCSSYASTCESWRHYCGWQGAYNFWSANKWW